MLDKNLVPKNIDRLTRQTFEQLQAQTVNAAIIALGSNHQADQHLATVHKKLAELGKIKLSTAYQNPDITATPAQPKPDYINQCVYITLNSSINLQQLQQRFKQFENDCNRQRQTDPNALQKVTMDIDILLISLEDNSEWRVMAERYPFKAHEVSGVVELAVEGV